MWPVSKNDKSVKPTENDPEVMHRGSLVDPNLPIERSPDKQWPLHSVDETLTQRGSKYGDYGQMCSVIQGLKKVMQESPNWEHLPPEQKEALELIATKQGRILTGDFNEPDNYHDIEGYARLAKNSIKVKAAE